jgi:hypothetical protein
MALTVYYEARKDKYDTYFGALKTTFKATDATKFIGSVFHTLEQEHFDIFAQYRWVKWINIGSETYGDVALLEVLGRNSITLGMIWMHCKY